LFEKLKSTKDIFYKYLTWKNYKSYSEFDPESAYCIIFNLFGWIAEVFNCIVTYHLYKNWMQTTFREKKTWDLNKTFCKTLKWIWANKRPNWKYYYFFERWDYLLEIHTLDNNIVYQFQKLLKPFLNENCTKRLSFTQILLLIIQSWLDVLPILKIWKFLVSWRFTKLLWIRLAFEKVHERFI
jgi:hypothetical protein